MLILSNSSVKADGQIFIRFSFVFFIASRASQYIFRCGAAHSVVHLERYLSRPGVAYPCTQGHEGGEIQVWSLRQMRKHFPSGLWGSHAHHNPVQYLLPAFWLSYPSFSQLYGSNVHDPPCSASVVLSRRGLFWGGIPPDIRVNVGRCFQKIIGFSLYPS